uniref:A to I editase domain-containing protein n=1 Tax=Panagrolaimus sp. ES5 TaxID=591445 RepID=A0AC34G0W3_9BILA
MLGEGTLKLRSEYSFHLYLSHSPNGDAARLEPIPWKFDLVFPVADYPIPPGLGQLSMKDNGINALKTASNPMGIPQTEGSLSSSDKMLKWNVCGIQGAILAKFIAPVHLNSISVENNYDSRHVSRALYCRAKVQFDLHYPYYLNKPILVSASE